MDLAHVHKWCQRLAEKDDVAARRWRNLHLVSTHATEGTVARQSHFREISDWFRQQFPGAKSPTYVCNINDLCYWMVDNDDQAIKLKLWFG